jgi:hypothetical protein
MVLQCSHCGQGVSDSARFCPACGTPTSVGRAKPCCWCGALAEEEAKFCVHCGRDPGELRPGIPVEHLAENADLFTAINSIDRGLFKASQRAHNGKDVPELVPLWEAGYIPPWDDPHENLVFGSTSVKTNQPLRLASMTTADRETGAGTRATRGLQVPGVARALQILATRSRIAFLYWRGSAWSGGVTPIEVMGCLAFEDLEDVQVRDLTMQFVPREGPSVVATWHYKPGGLPMLPKWLTVAAILGTDDAINARATAQADLELRRGRQNEQAALSEFLGFFGRAMLNPSR